MPPYRLPPPWDPGYAMPQNALDEGLERRAFVTKWAPRGTYDAPALANRTGYAIPDYVQREGYGQGALVTQWQPSGTAPNVPHYLNQRPRITQVTRGRGGARRVTVSRPVGRGGLSGTDATASVGEAPFPEPWGSYGIKAAQIVMNKVATMPQAQRKLVLQRICGAIDPTLWSRAAQITRRYIAAGMAPAPALQAGLARAMSAGIVAELHRTGKTGRYPSSGQVAIGMRTALGATAATGAGTTFTAVAPTMSSSGATSPPAEGSCTTSSDGQTFIWHKGAWTPLHAGEVCVSQAQGNYVNSSGFTSSQGSWPLMTGNFYSGPFALQRPIIQFMSGLGFSRPSQIPPDWKALVQAIGAKDGLQPIAGTGLYDIMAKGTPAQQQAYAAWVAGFGLPPPTAGQFYRVMVPVHQGTDVPSDKYLPLAVFNNPDDGGKAWEVVIRFWVHPDGSAEPVVETLPQLNPGGYTSGWLNTVGGAIGDVLAGIGGLACAAASSGSAAKGAAAAGGPAAAVGVGIASGLCGPQSPPPGAVAPHPSSLLPLAIAGVGLAAVFVLTMPKKKATP